MTNKNIHQYNILKNASSNIVNDLDELTHAYAHLVSKDGINIYKSISELKGDPFQQARIRMRSQLINVAVCGEFSSGKSFLISGLLNRIDWYLSEEKDIAGNRFDDYRSFLPASPEETTSCPLVIIGNDLSDDRSHFEVYFSDKKKVIGPPEDRSEPYEHEEDIQKTMLAYVTNFKEFRQARLRQDLGRKVIKARLKISHMPYPAVFHDLPGIGGATDEYLEVVQDAVRQADCVIYVASAEKPLSGTELDLLRFVEEIAESNRCPVFFVLSKIDIQPKWQRVLNKNNDFLQEAFRNDALVAEGFIPVSPALAAKAKDQLAQGIIDQSKHDDWLKNSGMPYLHEQLEKYLVNTSAPGHLRDIIFKMQAVQKALSIHISSQIIAAERPIQKAKEDIRKAQTLSQSLQKSKDSIHGRLLGLIEQQMSQAFSANDPDDLASELTSKLRVRINTQDLTRDTVRHELEQDIRKLRDAWLSREGAGLNDKWQKAWSDYQKQALNIVQEELAKAYQHVMIVPSAGLKSGTEIDLPTREIDIPIDAIASVVGLAGTALAGGGIAVGAIAIAVWPLAALFAAAGIAGFVVGLVKKSQLRKELREEALKHLETYAKNLIKELSKQGHESFMQYHSQVMDIVSNMIANQDDIIKSIQKRLEEGGDLSQNQKRIVSLNKLQSRNEKIEEQFAEFFAALPMSPVESSQQS